MISAKALKDWAASLPDDDDVYIDEGGLALYNYTEDAFLEVGGKREEEEDEDV